MIQNSFYSSEFDLYIDVEYEIVDIEFKGDICRFRLLFNDNTNDDNLFELESYGYFHGKGSLARTEKNINYVFEDKIDNFFRDSYEIPEEKKYELINQQEE